MTCFCIVKVFYNFWIINKHPEEDVFNFLMRNNFFLGKVNFQKVTIYNIQTVEYRCYEI